MTAEHQTDPRTVFVVHGRNEDARVAVFDFLRALGLRPLEWSQAVQLTGKAVPYIGEILDQAFSAAQAVVVLLTPDDVAYLRADYAHEDDPDAAPEGQARPNVLFEAGMAFGRHPERTVLVEMGTLRAFSDVAGRHAVRLTNDAASRKDLAQRLRQTGCAVDLSGSDWLRAGDLTPPPPPGAGLPLGKRLVKPPSGGVRVSARYLDRGKGNGRLQLTNHCSFAIHNLTIEVPEEAGPGFWLHQDEPVAKLPAGESAAFITSRAMADGKDHFEITIRGETPDGAPVETTAFVSLLG